MIRITLPNRTLGIAFSHPTSKVELVKKNGKKVFPRSTVCELYDVDPFVTHASPSYGSTLMGTATAHCSIEDNFAKEKGRAMSLARVLKQLAFTHFDKFEVWKQYHSRPGKKVKVLG